MHRCTMDAMTTSARNRPRRDGEVLPLATTPGHLIRRAQQRHTFVWTEEFGTDITGPQYAILSAAGSRPGSDQRTIGEAASLDKSSTADIVLRLTKRGWLVHERDAADGRRKTLQLSPLARVALPELTRKASLVQHVLLEALTPDEREPFVDALRQVAYAGAPPSTAGPVGSNVEGVRVLALHNAPGHLLRRAQQVHTNLWAEELGGMCTAPQYAVMSALMSSPDVDQRTLGVMASLDKSSMADVAERLLRRGWIERHRDPGDRRRWILRASDAARDALREVTSTVQNVQDRLLMPLSAEQRQRFVDGAQRLAYQDELA